jgi:uncharacterized membrane protein YgdD (TMEM256/DUF423 family)
MRILNAAACLSALIALALLASMTEAMSDMAHTDTARDVRVAALIQLAAAVTAVAVSGRAWRYDLPGGALLLAGGALISFGVCIYELALVRGLAWTVHLGGAGLVIGFITLALAGPSPKS